MAQLATHRRPLMQGSCDVESRSWLRALSGTGAEREAAAERLHALLLRTARFEIARRQRAFVGGGDASDTDDFAVHAADDALAAILRKLHTFRGDSRFTTWAYKFALLEAAVMMRRRAWQGREVTLRSDEWDRLLDVRRASPEDQAETHELIDALRDAIAEALTPHQRAVLVAISSTASRSTFSPSGSGRRAARSTRPCTTPGASCGRDSRTKGCDERDPHSAGKGSPGGGAESHMTSGRTFVIVGAGLAGAKAAETLRAEGFDGRLVLVGAEHERPYERPPLSKEYLRGEVEREHVYVHGEDFYAGHDIELRLDRSAVSLDTSITQVGLADGTRLHYDRLLLATGAEPRPLSVPGEALDGVLYLRNLEDCDALRERLDRGGSVVVVGAGWIGAEFAASARQRGLDVTVIDPRSVPLERVLGTEVGSIYRDIHADHGVRMLLETGVAAFEGATAVERVRTRDGRMLDCDFVVVGVGVRPRTALASHGRVYVRDGILVDEYLQTSMPGVFAAGDVAMAHHPLYDRGVRVEHWANALRQGPVAARNMLGRREAYDGVPYFFSDQYDVGMEYAGFAPAWDRVVLRGDPASRAFIAFWLVGDRVVAGMNVGVWDVNDRIQDLIRARAPVDDRRLADTDVALGDLALSAGTSAA